MLLAQPRLARLADRLLPRERPEDDDARFRLQFTVAVAWLAVAMTVVLTAVALPTVPSSAMATAISGSIYAAVGVGLKLGMAPRWGFWIIFATTWLLCALIPLGEQGPNGALLAWCAILPIAATLFDGPRMGALGFVAGLLCLGAMFLTASFDLPRYPSDRLLSLLRIITLMTTAFLIALTSARMRTKALAEAREAARARTLFLASMSHEFRTPMSGVIGLAETMLERPRTLDDHEALQLIKRSGRQLLELINDIIDFARMDVGRLGLKPAPTDLRALLDDAMDLTRAAFSKSTVVLRTDIPAEVPAWVVLDGLRTRQILTNLIANALKFTTTGEIVVAAAVEPHANAERLVFTVRDTGVGIPADAVERVFAPFEQVHGPQSFIGSGLGLAITRQLIELMRGSITLESEVGRGTRATFSLALVRGNAPQPVSSGLTVAERAPRTVLVVDDNEINLRVAMALVRRAGYQARSATNGREALDAMHEQTFEAVLMDCHMPEMDGFEATRRIRALGGHAGRTPIIAVTAGALADEAELCIASGMDDHTTKPLTLEDVERVLSRPPRPDARDPASAS